MKTAALSNYGQPITYYGIAYTLTEADNRQLAALDTMMKSRLKDVVYLAPKNSRHITIMNLTAVAEGHPDRLTTNFFEENVEKYRAVLQEVAADIPAFTVLFTRPEVRSGAIILRAEAQDQMDTLRSRLTGLPRFKSRLADPGFIHSTQARYRKTIEVVSVRKQLSDIKLNVPVTIDKIGIVSSDRSFSAPHRVLNEYKLKG